MKKLLISLLFFTTVISTAQNDTTRYTGKKHEIRLNVLNFVAFKKIDITYERILNEEFSTGISLLTGFGEKQKLDFFYEQDYAITPYFRFEFTNPIPFYANILMTAEIFTMIHGGTHYSNLKMAEGVKFNDVAVGFALGQKFITQNGFVLDSSAGIGRNLLAKKQNEIVLRMSVSFGYRF